ncbi:hypothetical protein [Rhodopseudomonas palustris]|uniref:hypothetical protein n=1 Tax=Rhodopseudomonas palustris TaxID=1076 RepID=UPI000D1A98AE|nr:hypothetical protein [Rhodopseudomonas palustris]
MGLAADSQAIMVVANLIPYKGRADLIDGLGLVRDPLPADWRLVLIGRDEGLGGAALDARASGLGIGTG